MALKAQPSQGLRTYRKSPSASLRITPVTVPLGSRENCQTPSSESNRVSDWGTNWQDARVQTAVHLGKSNRSAGKAGRPFAKLIRPCVRCQSGGTYLHAFIHPANEVRHVALIFADIFRHLCIREVVDRQ